MLAHLKMIDNDNNDRLDGEDDTFDFCFGILLTLRGSSPISKEDSKLAQCTAPRCVQCSVCSGSEQWNVSECAVVVDCPTSAVEHQYVPEFYRNSVGQWSVVHIKEKGDCEQLRTHV